MSLAQRLSLGQFNQQASFDAVLVMVVIGLLSMGLVVMTSASMEFADNQYGNAFFYLSRHSLYLAIGLLAGGLMFLVPVNVWNLSGGSLLVCAVILLSVVLIPGIGKEVNGSMRWLALGPLRLQPSEVVKFCVLVYLASYLFRRQEEIRAEWKGFLKPMAVLSIIIFLLLMEPDFGAVVVLMSAALGMMFLGGVGILRFFLLIIVSLGAAVLMALASPYRVQRLTTFVDPWADQYNSGYQLTQSLIAIGRGEWFGVGLGNSVQKLFYLPEAHTDFVFAIAAEELGLFGSLLILGLFTVFVIRVVMIASRCEKQQQLFSAYLAYGIAILFSIQVFINIGVNTGLLPTKGLTLPFFSYGGSSLVVNCVLVAVLLRIDFEARMAAIPAKIRQKMNSARQELRDVSYGQ